MPSTDQRAEQDGSEMTRGAPEGRAGQSGRPTPSGSPHTAKHASSPNRPRAGFIPPREGSIWRERRREYQGRRVRVVGITDTPNPYVVIDTLRTSNGRPPKRPVRTSVRGSLWHRTFEELTDCEDICVDECQGPCGVFS